MKLALPFKKSSVYAFIDASNLFYGGEKSLGWSIDYQKLIAYLRDKYHVSDVYYYGGIETHDFSYSILDFHIPIDLEKLLEHLNAKVTQANNLSEAKLALLDKHIQRVRFYRRLQSFGYLLRLKPVKIYSDGEGGTVKKANCDVDMTFDMMRLMSKYSEAIILSGDGDFVPVLSYLRHKGRKITILARSERAAREIKQLAGADFRDFHYLREILRFEAKK